MSLTYCKMERLSKKTQVCYNGNRKEQLQTFSGVSTPLSQMIEEGS